MANFKATVTRRGNAVTKLKKHLDKLAPRFERVVQAVAEWIYHESLDLVPRDTDALFQSAVLRQEGSGFTVVFVVGYARYGEVYIGYSDVTDKLETREPATYARWVHESESPNRPRPPGQIDFLQQPVLEVHALGIRAIIATRGSL